MLRTSSEAIDGLSNDLTTIANNEVHNSKINLAGFATAVSLIQAGDGLEKAKEAVRKAAEAGYSNAVVTEINHAAVKAAIESAVLGKNKARVVAETLGRRGATRFIERSAAVRGGQAAAKEFKRSEMML